MIDVHHQGQGTPVTQQIVLQNVDLTQARRSATRRC
ncbi:Uncharacterised protein [Chromobacterium violaceum]|uniref:Uncharacterized protein n=1 Tax=Chromobacterium violaceum TaxID=536 RepID=A0A3S4HM60_CHRVL|nr:Uncharacterised protein [Chromobacterium violaceum]